MPASQLPHSRPWLPWLMWSVPLIFFAFQFTLRLFPGLVMPDLIAHFNINATDFGFFAAIYYLGYAGMQIPIAILLDKYGPRVILSLSALLCAVACFIMYQTENWALVILSRFLIGVGSVVGFLGTSKIISLWFPAHHYGRMVGFTFSFGLIGAIYGGRPVSILIEQYTWQPVLGLMGLACGIIALFAVLVLRKPAVDCSNIPATAHNSSSSSNLKSNLATLFSNKALWLIAFGNFLMVGSLEGFADVWGVPYLMATHGLTKANAASMTSFVFIGMLFGGPILAFLAEKWNAHVQVTALCGLLIAVLMGSILFLGVNLSPMLICTFLFIIGILSCYQVVVFAIGANLVNAALMGIAIATLNCINMLGGSFFHTLIGRLMDFFWVGNELTANTYTPEMYTKSLWIIPICALMGALMVWMARKNIK